MKILNMCVVDNFNISSSRVCKMQFIGKFLLKTVTPPRILILISSVADIRRYPPIVCRTESQQSPYIDLFHKGKLEFLSLNFHVRPAFHSMWPILCKFCVLPLIMLRDHGFCNKVTYLIQMGSL